MIDDLLDASLLQAGALVLNRSEVQLDKVAQVLAKKFQVQSPSHTFRFNFPENFPIVIADEDRLIQVITNLLSNAVKYAKDGGRIGIIGQVKTDAIQVCVTDEGPGISPDDIPHIFDRFYRSSGDANSTQGTGLGLYLARAIVEAHDGRIWVDEKRKRGASICFSIPRM